MTTALLAIAIGLALIGAALAPRVVAPQARGAAILVTMATLASAGALPACGPQAEAVAADRIARATNATTASLAETYTLQGEALIDQAASREEALALLEAHRERWSPVWSSLDALAALHDAWIASLETGRASPETLAAMSEAWCALVRAVAAVGAELPVAARGLVACEVMP